jgi:hypothetical protein
VTIVSSSLASAVRADEEGQPQQITSKQDEKSLRRLAIFKEALAALKVESSQIKDPEKLKFVENPILRFDDPTREFFDGAVFRLGSQGRPTALATLEMYVREGDIAYLQHECISAVDAAFTVDTDRGYHWSPSSTDLKFVPIPRAPLPAKTEAARLIQMRAMMRRFSASEVAKGIPAELRLLPQPLVRYSDKANAITDGAIFAFVHGTNPEILLLVEAQQDAWSYGHLRMAYAKLELRLDDKVVHSYDEFPGEGSGGNYLADGYDVSAPR